MLSVTVACVGKLKEAYWRDACAEYAKRLSAFCRLTVAEVAEERIGDHPSPSEIEAVKEAEGKRLLSHISEGATVVALCIEGKSASSEVLAHQLETAAVQGTSRLVLVIGGSYGLSSSVKQRADLRLSMSPLTFPHQLARVMVLEQLYRVFQIASGGKYHK